MVMSESSCNFLGAKWINFYKIKPSKTIPLQRWCISEVNELFFGEK